MYYAMRYDFDNFEEGLECIPAIRNGTCFKFMDCNIKFYNHPEFSYIFFCIDVSEMSIESAKEKLNKVARILSFVFALSLCSNKNVFLEVSNFETNNLLSKKSSKKILYIEKKISSFKQTRPFFDEMLDLLNIAYENMFNFREVDAFVYFFKVIERIAKHHYLSYMKRHHTKSVISKNKKDLKMLIENYVLEHLSVALTDNMINTKIDLLYKDLKTEFYGSIFNKISLFISIKKIDVDINDVSNLVKVRNKIAHGDTFDDITSTTYLGNCEYLAMEMFSTYFFNKTYEKIHLKSYRHTKGSDVWGN